MPRRTPLLALVLGSAALLAAAEAAGQAVTIPPPSRVTPQAEPPAPPAIEPFRIPGAAPRQQMRQAPAQPQAPQTTVRPIVPLGPIRLTGETDSLAWRLALTPAEAEGATALSVGYTNAVVVMPEASRLRIIINGELAYNNPITSAAAVEPVTVPLRKGLLKAGENLVRIEALQRHRVDCNIRGTYDLWTDIDAATTGLVLPGDVRKTIGSLPELPAIGFDAAGATTIEIVAPNAARPEMRDRILRAVQAVAMRGRFPHPVVKVSERIAGPAPAGTLRVVLAPAAELVGVIAAPSEAATRPFAGLVTVDRNSDSVLVISGPSFADLDRAIASVAVPRQAGETTLPTASWSAPDAPLILDGREISFAQVGIPTTEFSGRRLTFRFLVALPGDFFASDYAEARLYLDAATTPVVMNGSRVDIYVNGNISATTPMVDRRSFQRYPVRVGMGQFKPGLNTVTIEAVLVTEADEQCAPGGTMPGANRVVVFDTTSFWIPRFARIGRRPDLAAMAAGDYPRGNDRQVALVLPRPDPQAYAAAGTILARIARDSGRMVPVRAATGTEVEGGSALFVGPIGQLPQQAMTQVGISTNARQNWIVAPPPEPAPDEARIASADPAFLQPPRPRNPGDDPFGTASAEDVRSRWTGNGGEGPITRAVNALGLMFRRAVDGITGAFRPPPVVAGAYDPPQGTTLVIAEAANPDGTGSWLVVAAPTDQALREGVDQITHPRAWAQVRGRVTDLQPAPERVRSQPVTTFSFVTTAGLSPANLRLIAANWLSTNLLPYALLVLLGCFSLGLATHLLVGRLGRRG